MSAGKFIVLEGGEGAGKSTQARLLAEELARRGIVCVQTREPGGTAGAEAIRTLLLHPPGDPWPETAEALLFAAARADHVTRLIRPALAEGRWVICDRFLDSSRAYQGVAGGLDDNELMRLHAFGSDGLLPDMTLVLDLPEDEAQRRLAARDGGVSDAIGGRPADYHRAVNAAFPMFARTAPDRYALIDAMGDPHAVAQRIAQALAPLLS